MDHNAAKLALRQTLLSTVVATTGGVSLTATGTGFTRLTGTFIGENFRVGMEVKPFGFTDNRVGVIRSLTATEMILTEARPSQPDGPDRSLTVGIPNIRGWENVGMTKVVGQWYIEEDYLPGPKTRVGMTLGGEMTHLPMYILRLSCPSGIGTAAIDAVSGAILANFPPGYDIPMPDGWPMRVSSDYAPERGQLINDEPGRATVTITIPLWKRSQNST